MLLSTRHWKSSYERVHMRNQHLAEKPLSSSMRYHLLNLPECEDDTFAFSLNQLVLAVLEANLSVNISCVHARVIPSLTNLSYW